VSRQTDSQLLRLPVSSPTGFTLNANVVPWDLGAWVEVIAAASDTVQVAGLHVFTATTTVGRSELLVGYGAVGDEQAVASYIWDGKTDECHPKVILFNPAINLIPAGARVVLAVRSGVSSGVIDLGLQYYLGGLGDTDQNTYGEMSYLPYASAGTVVTPNAVAWANSAWFEIEDALVSDINLAAVLPGLEGVDTFYGCEIDVATGAAAAEVVITTVRVEHCDVPESPMLWLPGAYFIPAGTRLSVRMRKGNTTTNTRPVSLLYYGVEPDLVVDAGPDQTINFCAGEATLAGSAEGTAPTFLWTQDSGPDTAVFADATDPNTTVTFPANGVYVLRLTATDGPATGFDTVTITVENDAPVVDAGPDQDVEWPDVVTLTGSATDDGGALTYLWTLVSGPATPVWLDDEDPTTTVEFPTIGTYVLQLAASDCALTGTDQLTITMHEAPYPPPAVVTNRTMRRLRRAPHLSNEGKRITFDKFQLDLETGLGIADGQGEDPQIMLRWSDDGGQTWSSEHWVSAGPQGEYKTRAIWRRLGQARDRVFEVTMTDPIPWRLIGSWIDVRMGRN
jgi:hypothetical protein